MKLAIMSKKLKTIRYLEAVLKIARKGKMNTITSNRKYYWDTLCDLVDKHIMPTGLYWEDGIFLKEGIMHLANTIHDLKDQLQNTPKEIADLEYENQQLKDKLSRRNMQIKELKKQLEIAQQTRIVLGETDKTISEVKAIRKENGQIRWLHFETPKTTSEIKERFTSCYSGTWEIQEIKNI